MKYLSLLFLMFFCLGCKKEKPEQGNFNPGQPGLSTWIVNEGNFQNGNASLSIYNKETKSITSEAFRKANGRSLGDVFQSITYYDDKAFLVVNNSGKIEVVYENDLLSVATITGLPSPRYMEIVNDSTAYVSNFLLDTTASSEISIIDIRKMKKISTISVNDWTGPMVKIGDHVFVLSVKKGQLLEINIKDQFIERHIRLEKEANSMVKDKDGFLWVLCDGGITQSVDPALFKVDPAKMAIVTRYKIGSGNPSGLIGNATGDTLYYINKGIFAFPVANTGQLREVIPGGKRNIYGLGIDPGNGQIYITDALDFSQKGYVIRFSPKSYQKIDSFRAGIIPSRVYFRDH